MDQDEKFSLQGKQEKLPKNGVLGMIVSPFKWVKKLSDELHWSFVLGVVIVYGINQGLCLGLSKISTQYYMKDEQKLQPSEAQVYHGMIMIPWIVKPLWGLLTDTVPIAGRRRRPYFILAGNIMTTYESSVFVPCYVTNWSIFKEEIVFSLSKLGVVLVLY
ncbi:UNVERIFIED_CONTAM: putative folate-biopterin transporter 3 [Sesamum indicum]